MGDWNTLHVFDDKRFYEETVPMLRGQKPGLEKHYSRFAKLPMLGAPRASLDEMIPIFRQFNDDFATYPGFDANDAFSRQVGFAEIFRGEYYLRRFFEFVVFSECASFFPHFGMGYRAFAAAMGAKQGDTVVEGLLSHIAFGIVDNPWRWDGDGIRSWVTARDVKVLHDSGSIVPKNEEDAEYVEDFLRFLGVVTKHNLGLLTAVNIDADNFKDCTPPLQNEDLWKGVEIESLRRTWG